MTATGSMFELRLVLLGNSWSQRSSVGNVLLGATAFLEEEPDQCLRVKGQLMETQSVVVINTPDLLRPGLNLTDLVENCVRLSDPGPHVILLVLQPEDFSEEQRLRLCRVLQLFRDRLFDQCLVLIPAPRQETSAKSYRNHPALKDPIEECPHRCLKLKNLELRDLFTHLIKIVKHSCDEYEERDSGLTMSPVCKLIRPEPEPVRPEPEHVRPEPEPVRTEPEPVRPEPEHVRSEYEPVRTEPEPVRPEPEPVRPEPEPVRPALNLVLLGRRGAGKTSAAKAILGQTELGSASSSSQCVKHQGEVCGRRVSLVELPALSGKAPETVMEESFRCVSLCDPEGVHAFLLVLPVAPLTDQDKAEVESIQNTFSSGVNAFTMILFPVDSDPTHPAVGDGDIQELSQSCGGGRRINKHVRRKQKHFKRLIKKSKEQKRETEQREKWLKKKDEVEFVQQKWRREIDASERRVGSKKERRERAERKVERCRKQVEREREAWDQEKKELEQNLEQIKTCCTKLWALLVFSCFFLLVCILWFSWSKTHEITSQLMKVSHNES